MSVLTAATFYIIFWFLACNWPFFLNRKLRDRARAAIWVLTLAIVLLVGYMLDKHYLGPPHQAWQESTVYVVFIFMSVLFCTVGYLLMKARTL